MIFFFPIGHEEETDEKPLMTGAIVGLCSAFFSLAVFGMPSLMADMAYRPADGPSINILLSTLAHASLLHLLFNMVFLSVVGALLEQLWGPLLTMALFILGGLGGTAAWELLHPGTDTAILGASGAVAAMMAATVVRYPTAGIRYGFVTLATFGRHGRHVGSFVLPVWVAFSLWFVSELVYMWLESQGLPGTAHSAHVGGFLTGIVLAFVVRLSGLEPSVAGGETPDEIDVEEDDYGASLSLARAGDAVGARRQIDRLLLARPRHAPGLELATRLSLELGDPGRAAHDLAELAVAAPTDRDAALTALFAAFDARAGGTRLPASAMVRVVASAIRAGRLEIAVQATRRLLRDAPETPEIPRLLGVLAEQQMRVGRTDLAARTLAVLRHGWPDDAATSKVAAAVALRAA